jgi:hypothetical protein
MNLAGLDPDAPICTSGKRPFRTETEARANLRNARHLRTANPDGGRVPGSKEQGVYQCAGCGWWHLNSRPLHARRAVHARRGERR